jgi:hypothetical protein
MTMDRPRTEKLPERRTARTRVSIRKSIRKFRMRTIVIQHDPTRYGAVGSGNGPPPSSKITKLICREIARVRVVQSALTSHKPFCAVGREGIIMTSRGSASLVAGRHRFLMHYRRLSDLLSGY